MPAPAETQAAGALIGADLRFWSTAAKLAVALLAGQRYLPALAAESSIRSRAFWQPVLDEPPEAEQVSALVAAMPPACRALTLGPQRGATDPTAAPGPRALLTAFLGAAVDRAVRAWMPAPRRKTRTAAASAGAAWLEALYADDPTFAGTKAGLADLHEAWRAWVEHLRAAGGRGFRICFRLEAPEASVSPGQRAWGLRYLLQATDDLSLLVPAEEVWRAGGTTLSYLNRRFDAPQESLLAGLGLAARLFEPVEASLRQKRPEEARLSTDEAYGFLREVAPCSRRADLGCWCRPGGANVGQRASAGGLA